MKLEPQNWIIAQWADFRHQTSESGRCSLPEECHQVSGLECHPYDEFAVLPMSPVCEQECLRWASPEGCAKRLPSGRVEVPADGVEPRRPAYETGVLPLDPAGEFSLG